MNQLYDIERRATQKSDQERGELRAKESRRILDRLGEYLEGPVAKSVLPASKLGGAFNYIRNHWEALNVFVNDGALPIDNNQVERLMKRIAVGRKNWLFIGSLRAGIRNASLMSLVASALRQDLDVAMYLESVITHMLRGTAIAGDPSLAQFASLTAPKNRLGRCMLTIGSKPEGLVHPLPPRLQVQSKIREARRADTQDLLRHSWLCLRVLCQPSGLDECQSVWIDLSVLY
jgi:hypothetical protein